MMESQLQPQTRDLKASSSLVIRLSLAVLAIVSPGMIYCASQNASLIPGGWSVRSPSGKVELHVDLASTLTCNLRFNGQAVIEPSPLGLELEQLPGLTNGPLRFLGASETRSDTQWENHFGKNNPVRDQYREIVLRFSGSGAELDLVARAYDDGAAFRYVLPNATGGKALTLTREKTEFHFATDPYVWASTYEKFSHAYEHEYPRMRLGSLYPSQLIGLPFLVQTSTRSFVAITEADLTDWAGLYLRNIGRLAHGTGVSATLSPRLDGKGLVQIQPAAGGGQTIRSPWRVLMVAETPGKLIESDLIVNLNPSSAIADTSWIKPGKIMWDHWWSGDVKMDNDTEKRFIQFASNMGFPYQLVDWQWYGPFNKPEADITKPAPQLDMPALLEFARERNVRLWVWIHSGDVNRALEAGTLDRAFRVYEDWGLAGVKIDFMDRDDQEMVRWYAAVVELAAQHRLMVDFHGAYKPTGLRRTWPNLLTREGVLGNEYNKFSGRVTPEHKLTLPFTRMLAGPMDYTPGGFLNRSPEEWRQTTPTEVMGSRAQELAMFVVYQSALQCVADDPQQYRGQAGLKFLRDVPTVWDETRVLDGTVGRHIVIARRSGRDWFLGGMTGDERYQIDLPLSFLGKGKYDAEIYADSADANSSYSNVNKLTKSVERSDALPVNMRPAGGIAVHFAAR